MDKIKLCNTVKIRPYGKKRSKLSGQSSPRATARSGRLDTSTWLACTSNVDAA